MKTRITVSWAVTVEQEVDPERLGDVSYVEQIQDEAEAKARQGLDINDGMITDCEDFPELCE